MLLGLMMAHHPMVMIRNNEEEKDFQRAIEESA
jgi:hypothetical protein